MLFCSFEMCFPVSTASLEPLWSFTEVPSDDQRVALLTSFVVNPGEFYCWIDNPKGKNVLLGKS